MRHHKDYRQFTHCWTKKMISLWNLHRNNLLVSSSITAIISLFNNFNVFSFWILFFNWLFDLMAKTKFSIITDSHFVETPWIWILNIEFSALRCFLRFTSKSFVPEVLEGLSSLDLKSRDTVSLKRFFFSQK